ncbi:MULTISPECIES: hypothetical protein [unclassified Amycolatopsis]|uniref:hypothetical protein n=1 Tax=unclassified Amycolatopsis TaxID=2618356 RepID=UPI001C6A2917|nr:hypothetical protein [Amycolatopsis sp. DSM 110486]QYN19251.1 hypothetical protein K1T34_42555 [Amycolatopsis sp. DSM 110486]
MRDRARLLTSPTPRRVAADGDIAAARLLEADHVFRLAGSDDPALQILLDHTTPAVTPVGTRGRFQACARARGEADGAAIHLRHRDGDYNAPSPAPGIVAQSISAM